ncbi:MAG: flagellar hook-length control protein FliK [Gemmatales bacterium]|nr:flagellar hook-length control protein FliK [Gemmatales bacterium]MDW8175275.1 flagellar hook-length control protein FliK [Gemmatales bacterium]
MNLLPTILAEPSLADSFVLAQSQVSTSPSVPTTQESLVPAFLEALLQCLSTFVPNQIESSSDKEPRRESGQPAETSPSLQTLTTILIPAEKPEGDLSSPHDALAKTVRDHLDTTLMADPVDSNRQFKLINIPPAAGIPSLVNSQGAVCPTEIAAPDMCAPICRVALSDSSMLPNSYMSPALPVDSSAPQMTGFSVREVAAFSRMSSERDLARILNPAESKEMLPFSDKLEAGPNLPILDGVPDVRSEYLPVEFPFSENWIPGRLIPYRSSTVAVPAQMLFPLRGDDSMRSEESLPPIPPHLATEVSHSSIVAPIKDIKHGSDSPPLYQQIVQAVREQPQALRQEIPWRLSLRLEPPELGHLEIHVRMQGSDLEAHFRTEYPSTQFLLEQQRAQLQEHLNQLGISVRTIVISFAGEESRQHRHFERGDDWPIKKMNRPRQDAPDLGPSGENTLVNMTA